MDEAIRKVFNAAFGPDLYARMMNRLENRVGPVPFRVAETPLIFTPALRDSLVAAASDIVAQLSRPAIIAEMRKAVPARYDVPGMDELPNTAQVDFAIVRGRDGAFEGRLVELQGFPSLYALTPVMSDVWAEVMQEVPGLGGDWSCYVGGDRRRAMELMRRTLLDGCDPAEVVLVDIAPEKQKTAPDFAATREVYGIESDCLTRLIVRGRSVFRMRNGREVPVRRIYNRVVFDELEAKRIAAPFRWTEPLDVTWCSHPNWYWTWSKYSLPYIRHPWAPRSRFLSEVDPAAEDLSRSVLKPLFSFAGGGVCVDVTREALDRIPRETRGAWLLQEKIEYAPAILMPDGGGVKAEVRVMFARPRGDKQLTPVILLVRLSRGKMLGVDFNKDLSWVGGSVGMWPAVR